MSIKYVYLIGIGGIGMSALARYYKNEGVVVAGYDRVAGKLTRTLESEGMDIHYQDSVSLIPEYIKENPDMTLVIYTPAIPADHSEYLYFKEKGFRIVKRSEALGEIASGKRTLAVAGTHGKTTTSTLLAHICRQAGKGCTAFLGGISVNYGTNLLLDRGETLVAEADEFDRSFHHLNPHIAVITSADADHLDIYSNYSNVKEAFEIFASQIDPDGALVIKKDCGLDTGKAGCRKIWEYSFDKPCDCYASAIRDCHNGFFVFDINFPGGKIEDCTMGIPGWVNVENAIAATAASLLYGIGKDEIKKALASFSGVARRFDIKINSEKCAYIDDYAHHPKELSAAISSIRNIFPGRRLTAVFQPHLYTRTRDFAGEFAKSLSMADELILLDIYPAREEPIPGITSEIIFRDVSLSNKILVEKGRLMEVLQEREIDTLVTFGAGDIDRFVDPITKMLQEKYDV
jgi:UDP-N-acetylmuramate--alanine ligase